MGIKDFSKTFTSTRIVKWSQFRGKTVAIDAMTELYRASLGMKNLSALTDKDGNSTVHINVILANIIELGRCDVKSVWVFDYDNSNSDEFHNPAKLAEIIERRRRKDEAKKKIDELEEALFDDSDNEEKKDQIAKQEKRAFGISKEMINDTKMLLNCLNIPYVEAPQGFEGEHIAAYMSSIDLVDAVYSADTDSIPCGAKVFLRKNPRDKKIYEYTQEDILGQIQEITDEESTIDDIRKICAILGSDFSKRTRRVGAKTVVKKYRNIELADDQENAIREFSKIPDVSYSLNFNNYMCADTTLLMEWLVNVKAFSRDRVQKWFDKVPSLCGRS